MIIPRRDLLTGTALVVAGSISGCARAPETTSATSQAAGPPPQSAAGAINLLRTPFMADFTAKFIGDPAKMPAPGQLSDWPNPRLWPDPNANLGRDAIAAQCGMFGNLLMTFGYVSGPPPAKPSDPLGANIWQFLVDQNWPDGTPGVTGYSKGTVTKVEIAVILDRVLQALNTYPVAGITTTGGGPPGTWPPH